MILYEAKYKKGLFWKTVKDVKGDFWHEGNFILILKDESQFVLPKGAAVKLSKERFYSIKERMESETGQTLAVNTNA